MSQGFKSTEPIRNTSVDSDPVRANFNALATCMAGGVSPSNPLEGWLWLDTSDPTSYELKQYISGAWLTILTDLQGGAPTQGGLGTYVHTQGAAAVTWTITHSLDTSTPGATFYDATGLRIYPDTEQVVSADILQATFLVAVAGTAAITG